MRVPGSLVKGDKIGIVSTARKISLNEMQPAIDQIHVWGLEVEVGRSIGAEHFQFAGDDLLRTRDFQKMLDDDSIRAILFARGGYGTVRIIDEIDWRKFLKKPKWLCGYSDITVIHSHLHTVYEVPSVHSIMAVSFSNALTDSIESLEKILIGTKLEYEIASHSLNRNGRAEGILCGGNLSVLCSLSDSASDLDTSGKILFLEDIDEHLYHVDRMIMNLKRSGKLENLSGLVVGSFTDMKNKDTDNPFGQSAYEIIAERVKEYDYPVCFGFPVGHEPDNRALVIGARWKLNVGGESQLEWV